MILPSKIYVRTKKRRAKKMGIIQDIYQMPADTEQAEALALIDKLNADPTINGGNGTVTSSKAN